MKTSVSMYSLNRTIKEKNWSVADFIHYATDIPVNGVELVDIYWKDPDREVNMVREMLQEHQLVVSAYDVSNNFVKDSAKEREEEIQKVIAGMYIAKQLGTNIVRIFSGDRNHSIQYDEAMTYIVESIKQCAAIAEKEAVYLAIENHGLLAGTSEQIYSMIQDIHSPYVKSTFDTGNFLLVHEKPEDALERLKEEMVHVHFKDFRQKQVGETVNGFRSTKGEELIGVIPGDGLVDLTYLIKRLYEIDYTGWLSIEYEGLADPMMANQEAIYRLNTLLSQSNRGGR